MGGKEERKAAKDNIEGLIGKVQLLCIHLPDRGIIKADRMDLGINFFDHTSSGGEAIITLSATMKVWNMGPLAGPNLTQIVPLSSLGFTRKGISRVRSPISEGDLFSF